MSCDDAVAAAPPSAWPDTISLNGATATLDLVWDGRPAVLSHRALRRSCRCSVCENMRRATNAVLPVPADVKLLKIEPVGPAAVHLVFSDGHARGIYPWTYLKQMAFGPATGGLPDSLTKGWRDE
jgi:DUF971 family protein